MVRTTNCTTITVMMMMTRTTTTTTMTTLLLLMILLVNGCWLSSTMLVHSFSTSTLCENGRSTPSFGGRRDCKGKRRPMPRGGDSTNMRPLIDFNLFLSSSSMDEDGGVRTPGRTVATPRPKNKQQQQQQQQHRNRRPNVQAGQGVKKQPRSNGNHNHNSNHKPNPYATLNKQIIEQDNAQEILSFLASKKGALSSIAGGGIVSVVNFSTAVHRIAKHLSNYSSRDDPGNNRPKILSDPRFALLVCGVAEAILDGAEIIDNGHNGGTEDRRRFGGRELSTVSWALAKLNIAPPQSAMAVDLDGAEERLRQKTKEVRSEIFDIARQRAAAGGGGGGTTTDSSKPWIPKLSELCGLTMDTIVSKSTKLNPRSFRQVELSNLIYSLATTQRSTEEAFDFVVNSMIQSEQNPKNLDISKPQEWSIPLWCCAKSGIADPGERLILFINTMMKDRKGFVEQFKPQELSNLAWATATVLSKQDKQPDGVTRDAAIEICRHAARELIRRNGEGYKSQELTNSVWSLATLGFGISEEQSSRSSEHIARMYTYLPSDDPDGDRVLMEQSLEVVVDRARSNLRAFPNQELNNLCWAMARLGRREDALLEEIGYELASPRRRDLLGQDISASLWSMATLGYWDKDVYRSIAARACDIGASNFNAQEISNTLWAFGTANVAPKFVSVFDDVLLPEALLPSLDQVKSDPITVFFREGANEMIRRPEQFKPQEIKDVLLAFVWTGTRHPALFRATAEHLVGTANDMHMSGRGLDMFNSQSLANLAYTYSRHAQLGTEVMEKYGERCNLPPTGGRLAAYTTSFLDIGESLQRKLFSEIAETALGAHDNMSKFSAQDIANTAWSFTTVGLKHGRFLKTLNEVLQLRMTKWLNGERRPKNKFTGQEVSNALYTFAVLNYLPYGLLKVSEAYVLDRLGGEISVENVSRMFNRKELSILSYTISVFGEYPAKLVEVIYTGLIGAGGETEASAVEQVYNDGGLQESAIMSLLYLQAIMDLETSGDAVPFTLPTNFPAGWSNHPAFANHGGTTTARPSSSEELMNSGLLELNTSKVQKRISEAFTRVGFTHVEEFVFTMEELSKQHGIRMTPYPVKLLSVDIADAKSKICVEVDGPGHFITNIDVDRSADGRNILSSVGLYRNSKGFKEYDFHWDSESQEINGSTSLKIRLMQRLGWNVINLPFWEWYPIQGDVDKEDEYCRSLLPKGSPQSQP